MNIIRTLKNKTKYIHIQNKDDNIFTIILNINIGSKYETSNNAGISHFIEHVFFGDTKKISIVTKLLDKYGMDYNASTGVENTLFYINCLNQYAEIAIYIIYSMLYENLFNKDIIERERKIVLQEFYNLSDNSEYILDKQIYKKLFKNGLLDSNVIGTEKSLKSINRNNIVNYIKNFYCADKIIICTANNQSYKKYYKLINKLFNNNIYKISNKNKQIIEKYNNPLNDYKQLSLKKENIYINISFRISKYNFNNNIYYEFVKTILTDGLYSKLYKLLRTENPLIYNIKCNIETFKYGGIFNILTSISSNNFKEVLTILINQLINNNEFNQNELDNAKNKLLLHNKSLENDHKSYAHYLLNLYIYTNKLYNINNINKIYNNIKLHNLNKFYKNKFNKKNMYILFTI